MQAPLVRRRILQGIGLLMVRGWMPASAAGAQGIELAQLETARREGALTLEFAARITLPRTVEEALHHGVPVYFVAEADLRRSRWYWRDERVARVARTWRVAYQPLTATWRVALGGFSQSYPTLPDAIGAVSHISGWKIADVAQLDPDSHYYIEFGFRLDTSQLPSPMQIGLGGQGDWAIGIERTLRVEREP